MAELNWITATVESVEWPWVHVEGRDQAYCVSRFADQGIEDRLIEGARLRLGLDSREFIRAAQLLDGGPKQSAEPRAVVRGRTAADEASVAVQCLAKVAFEFAAQKGGTAQDAIELWAVLVDEYAHLRRALAERLSD